MSFVGLVLKNALRSKLRTLLTVLGVALAIVAFVFLQTVLTAWKAAAEHAAQDRIAIRHKLSFVISLPKRYIDVVRGADGVEAATWANWVGAKDPNRPDQFFATLAVDPESYLEVYDELSITDTERRAWLEDRRGALVGDVLARNLGLEVGDTITLSGTIYPGDHQYNVSGIYEATRRSIDRSQFLIHWDYLNESIDREDDRDQIGWIVARVSDSDRAADISAALDRDFRQREVPTLSMSERAMNTSFLGMLSALLSAVEIISGIILLILLMILGNTMAMGVRERQTEFAVMRALGFRPRHVVAMILGEGVAVGLLAGFLGLALAYPLVEMGIGRFMEENMSAWFPYFRIAPRTYGLAVGLALALGLVAGALPALRTSRLTVTSALRRVA